MVLLGHGLSVELSIHRLFCMVVVPRAERFGGYSWSVTDKQGGSFSGIMVHKQYELLDLNGPTYFLDRDGIHIGLLSNSVPSEWARTGKPNML
jgi:hypothetical protein